MLKFLYDIEQVFRQNNVSYRILDSISPETDGTVYEQDYEVFIPFRRANGLRGIFGKQVPAIYFSDLIKEIEERTGERRRATHEFVYGTNEGMTRMLHMDLSPYDDVYARFASARDLNQPTWTKIFVSPLADLARCEALGSVWYDLSKCLKTARKLSRLHHKPVTSNSSHRL